MTAQHPAAKAVRDYWRSDDGFDDDGNLLTILDQAGRQYAMAFVLREHAEAALVNVGDGAFIIPVPSLCVGECRQGVVLPDGEVVPIVTFHALMLGVGPFSPKAAKS